MCEQFLLVLSYLTKGLSCDAERDQFAIATFLVLHTCTDLLHALCVL